MTEKKDKRNYISLMKAAKLAGITYRTAWKYTQIGDLRIEGCKRFPQETGAANVLYTPGIVGILEQIYKENRKKQGRPKSKARMGRPKLARNVRKDWAKPGSIFGNRKSPITKSNTGED